MNYRILGRTGEKVSEIGLGAPEIGRDWPHWRKDKSDFARPDEKTAVEIVEKAIDLGVNLIDTAPAYFKSEEILGKALIGKREKIVLATKCGEWFDGKKSVYDYSFEATGRFIEWSLRKLRTEWIDLLQIHSGSAEVVERGETMNAMKKAQREGKVRFLGISVDREDAALAALSCGDYDCIQLTYNLLSRTQAKRVLPLALEKNVGIIVKEAFATGRLTHKYQEKGGDDSKELIEDAQEKSEKIGISLTAYALGFILNNASVSSIIVGTKNVQHLVENIEAAQMPRLLRW